jgi:hypothetical protein
MPTSLLRRLRRALPLAGAVACAAFPAMAAATEYHGTVTFGGVPVPGATVTLTHAGTTSTAVTDTQGVYFFPDLADGTWTAEVQMLCFVPLKQEVTVGAGAPAGAWELKLLSMDQIRAAGKLMPAFIVAAVPPPAAPRPAAKSGDSAPPAAPTPPPDETAERAADGLLINGSVNNAATSPYSLSAAFGNNRTGGKGLYNGGFGLVLDNSSFDARPYSLSGIVTPKAAYNRVTGTFNLGGPIRIPHLLRNGPNFFVGYQLVRDRNASTQSALLPDQSERTGDFSHEVNALGQPLQVFNPATPGIVFPGEQVPVSPRAQALLNLYPAPNITGNPLYNYQTPIVGTYRSDSVQARLNKSIGQKNQVYGDFSLQSSRSNVPNLFAFLDTTGWLGINTGVNWSHRFNQRTSATTGYRFSRISTRVTPYWEDRENISGDAGISGNNQDAMDWGPPTLGFSSGVAGLSDANSSFNRNRTDALSYTMQWNRRRHNVTAGVDFRRQEYNYLAQQNPRGTLTFTGAATQTAVNGVATGGSDVADFLLGVPDTSALATGNPDKYLRQSAYDAYATDDIRINSQLTINAGLRWEYGSPIVELKDRLVNLSIPANFATATPVLASAPGTLPTSLIRPDRLGIQPRVGLSWRPFPGSSVIVRAGYGVYDDTSVYQATAVQMAQQAPLSKSLSVQNSAACPLSLASPFNVCPSTTADLFAADPNFRVGYAQTWQLAVQRDLPASLQMTVTYLGVKGTHGMQEFLPNTYPIGGVDPCPACPLGYAYLTSGGDSSRESGQVQLRRRLHNGLTASLLYTYSKSIDDDAALGGQGPVATGTSSSSSRGLAIAQDWRNLHAERGLSTFDQRHVLNASMQYTTGQGLGGKTLLGGWKGVAYKEWTVLTSITAGTGLPESPIYPFAVPGTGFSGIIRPNVTGAPIQAGASGRFLNPVAYTAPLAGQWGNAARNSITGPNQFTLNASLSRTFRLPAPGLKDKLNLDIRLDSTNLLNHVTYTSWNTSYACTVDTSGTCSLPSTSQFGLPQGVNGMRTVQLTARLRF